MYQAHSSLCKWPPELTLGFMLFHNAPNERYRPFETKTISDLHDGFGVLEQAGQRAGVKGSAHFAKRRTIPMPENITMCVIPPTV